MERSRRAEKCALETRGGELHSCFKGGENALEARREWKPGRPQARFPKPSERDLGERASTTLGLCSGGCVSLIGQCGHRSGRGGTSAATMARRIAGRVG